MFSQAKELQQFMTQVEAKDATAALKLLTPELLTQVTNSGETLVHLVAKCLDQDLFSEVCSFVVKHKPEILNKPDLAGNTPLHVVCGNNKFSAVKCLLTNLGAKADDAAKTVNNVGILPIERVDQNPLQTEADQIRKELVTHMERHHLPPMSHQINVYEVLQEYPDERKKIPAFEHAVRTLVKAMNSVPPTFSSTHPRSALVDKETNPVQKTVAHQKIEELRYKINSDAHKFYSEYEVETQSLHDLTDKNLVEIAKLDDKRLKQTIESANEDFTKPLDLGNCDEQAIKVIVKIHELDPNLYAEKLYFKLGDHTIVAITIPDPENPDAPFIIFGDYFKKVVCTVRNYQMKLGFYRNYVDEAHKIYIDVYGPLNPNYHVLLPERMLGNPYCFFSNVGILIKFNLAERKRFFLAKDKAGNTEMHEIAKLGEQLRIKIYVKFINEFKDPDLKKKILLTENNAGLTPLDSSTVSFREPSIKFLFDEYLKLFADLMEFFNFLLRKKYQFFRAACDANNVNGINVAWFYFAKFQDLIIQALQSLLIEFIHDDDPNSIKKLEFLAGYSQALWTDQTKLALKTKFLATSPEHPKHKIMWEMCKLRVCMLPEAQHELLSVHPCYLGLFQLHDELSQIKAAEFKASQKPGLFKPSFFQKKRQLCLKDFPDTLIFDDDLVPNISLEKMRKKKEFLQPTEPLVDSFTGVAGLALAVAQCS